MSTRQAISPVADGVDKISFGRRDPNSHSYSVFLVRSEVQSGLCSPPAQE